MKVKILYQHRGYATPIPLETRFSILSVFGAIKLIGFKRLAGGNQKVRFGLSWFLSIRLGSDRDMMKAVTT